MELNTTQKTIFAILAIFIVTLMVLLTFCVYSSRRARLNDQISQKQVLGKWKENGVLTSSESSQDSGFQPDQIPSSPSYIPPVPTIPHIFNHSDTTISTNGYAHGPRHGQGGREEKRGSGLAGIGTFANTSITHKTTSPNTTTNTYTDPNTRVKGLVIPSNVSSNIGMNRDPLAGGHPSIKSKSPLIPSKSQERIRTRQNVSNASRPRSWAKSITSSRSRSKSHVNEKQLSHKQVIGHQHTNH
ncbi:uncharacterized protein IL334_005083 [Kwoniella shivajii]|uniref:Uncharacterized protein n=1 Tax=Kwoniella shivajii TaxID=564305 RepID=A0ABZ1D262_9TREE|nr:hypothetical protein IL334_005083 [Kwoniella shivajii]